MLEAEAGLSWSTDAPARGNLEIVKEPKNHCCYQTANALLPILAGLERPGQAKNGGSVLSVSGSRLGDRGF
jgi:hypothetical protein